VPQNSNLLSFNDFSSFFFSDALPEECLLLIFKELSLHELITSVQLVCKRFHILINSASVLWKCFNFDIELNFKSVASLEGAVTTRIECLQELAIPDATSLIPTQEIDKFFSTKLICASKLTYLDINEIQTGRSFHCEVRYKNGISINMD
jgi:hypothetical protein